MRLMVKEPNKPVEEKNIEVTEDNELELMQGLVGGYIEVLHIGGDVKVIVNEEGMFKNLENNCGFLGTIVFVKEVFDNNNEAVWGSLTSDDVRKVKAWTINHLSDQHISGPVQILQGEALIKYRNQLMDDCRRKQMEWESF